MSMKAIVVQEHKKAAVLEISQPKLRNDYVKIKVVALALNPTDWKHIDFVADKGAIIGVDVAGVVIDIGSDVKHTNVKIGDHVYGFTHGGNVSNHEDGGFAEYALLKDGAFAKVWSSFEEGASLPCGLLTVGQGLYQSLQLPSPDKPAKEPFPILIYGGSTATGMLAIQFAKLSKLTVVTTASKHNHDLVKGFGADAVFDYNDQECAKKIKEYTKDKLYYVFDCITNDSSMKISAESLSSKAPEGDLHYSSLIPVEDFPRKDVKTRSTLAYTALGESFHKFGKDIPASRENREFAIKFWKLATDLVASGNVKPQAIDGRKGTLEDVLVGLQEMREGKVSGKKIVYTIASA